MLTLQPQMQTLRRALRKRGRVHGGERSVLVVVMVVVVRSLSFHLMRGGRAKLCLL